MLKDLMISCFQLASGAVCSHQDSAPVTHKKSPWLDACQEIHAYLEQNFHIPHIPSKIKKKKSN